MFKKLDDVVFRFEELEGKLAEPEVTQNQKRFVALAKEHADLSKLVQAYREYLETQRQIEENRTLLEDPDPELRDLARQELEELKEKH